MNTRACRLFIRSFLLVGLAVLPVCQGIAAEEAGPLLELPMPRLDLHLTGLAVDAADTFWILKGNSLFFWDGTGFRDPVSMDAPGDRPPYWMALHAGPDHSVYAVRRSEKPRGDELYRLADGRATLTASLYTERQNKLPCVYISRSGRIYNWGTRFLACLNDNGWERIEAALQDKETVVFDLGQSVFFYAERRLYRADQAGLAEQPLKAQPQWLLENCEPGHPLIGAAWNKTCAFLVQHDSPGRMLAFDLITGEEVVLNKAHQTLRRVSIQDLFPGSEGSVWMWGYDHDQYEHAFFKMDAAGVVTRPFTRSETPPWHSVRAWKNPEVVLHASSGACFLAMPSDGIAMWKDGKLSRMNWRQGLGQGGRYLAERSDGSVWTANGPRLVQVWPRVPKQQFESGVWEEYTLWLESRIWETSPEGHLAMFRKDRPDALSRWDGYQWSFQPVPFNPDSLRDYLVDDQAHLLVTSTMDGEGAYDIGPETVTRHKSWDALLLARAQQGVKTFHDADMQAIAVSPNQVWFAHNLQELMIFDSTFPKPSRYDIRVRCFHMTPDLGSIVNACDGLYRYDRGQLVLIKNMPTDPSLIRISPDDLYARRHTHSLLLGVQGLQPYDRDLALRFPALYYPVLMRGGERRLYFSVEDFEAARDKNASDVRFVTLPENVGILRPSSKGGAWLERRYGRGLPARLIAKNLFYSDNARTPLDGKTVLRTHEDRAGNIWFLTDLYNDATHAFVRRREEIRIQLDAPPTECGRTLPLRATITPEHLADEVQCLARVNGSDWMSFETNGPAITLRFPASGQYEVEIGGLLMGTRIQPAPAFTLTATVNLPKVIRTDAGAELTIHDPFWRPPVELRPADNTAAQAMFWRVGDEAWRPMPSDNIIRLLQLAPGRYLLSFVAEEDGFWRDTSPTTFTINYAPDYEIAIDRRTRDLLHPEESVRRLAQQELVELGSVAGEAIKDRIKKIEEEAKLLAPLREVFDKVETNARRQ